MLRVLYSIPTSKNLNTELDKKEAIKNNISNNEDKAIINEKLFKEKPTDNLAESEAVLDKSKSHLSSTYLYIEANDATSGKPIVIDFTVVDLARKAKLANVQSHTVVLLKEPSSASKMIQIQSNNIGWKTIYRL